MYNPNCGEPLINLPCQRDFGQESEDSNGNFVGKNVKPRDISFKNCYLNIPIISFELKITNLIRIS